MRRAGGPRHRSPDRIPGAQRSRGIDRTVHCSRWTISWQGSSGNITPGTTILQGIRAAAGPTTTVTYNQRGTGIDRTYRAAIAVVGETPYAEGPSTRVTGRCRCLHRVTA